MKASIAWPILATMVLGGAAFAADLKDEVKVAGKVFDAEGKVIGTATATTRRPVLNPNDKADVDLEFLTVTGPLLKQVKNQELSVVAVGPKP